MVSHERGPHGRPEHAPALRDPATTPRALRRWNAEVILDALRGSSVVRVADLVETTGLSRPTVNAAVDELVGLGLVVERPPDPAETPRRGRPGRRLAFGADRGAVLGLDIGEFTARAAVADLRGDIRAERRHVFDDVSRGGTHRLAAVRALVGEVVAAAGVPADRLLAAGVGISGGVRPETGRVAYSGALPAGLDLVEALDLPCPAHVDNDANLAALAELWRGSARGLTDVVCVLASERLGAGLVVGGRLVRGHGGAAGEMAFLGPFAEDTGAEGVTFHARTIGREALADAVAHAPGPRHPGGLVELTGGQASRLEAETVFAAARAGDPLALSVVDRAVRMPAKATATLALVLDPELVVLGGAVARAGETLLEPFRRRFGELARALPRIAVSPLAERGVLLGAVRNALDHVEPRLLEPLGTESAAAIGAEAPAGTAN